MNIKSTLLATLVAGISAVCSLQAQQKTQKMILHYPPLGEGAPARTQGFFVNKIDSITFREGKFDLGFKVDFKHINRDKGKLSVKVGRDVEKWRMHIIEEWKVKNAPDQALIDGMLKNDPKITDRYGSLESGDLAGLLRKERYQLIAFGSDADRTEGDLVRYSFEIPDFPLLGNPKVDVTFKDITQTGFKVSLKPNEDVSGYYFIADARATGDESYKQTPWGEFPSMATYLTIIGGDFRTRQPHKEPTIDFEYTGFTPNTLYGIYLVLLDKEGQPSDLIVTDVRTLKKGTDKPSVPKIKVTNVTDTSISAEAEADENTSVFRMMCVEKQAFDSNREGLIKYMLDEPDSPNFPWKTDKDQAEWRELKSDFEYYIVALGKNANDEVGEPVIETVRTQKAKASASAPASTSAKPAIAPRKMASTGITIR